MPTSRARRYTVKEIFGPTVQGEGGMTGVPCHFVRLAGCNMWDGRMETRAASLCPFCDTDFFKGDKMTAQDIVRKLRPLGRMNWVTISGGEPALQLASHNELLPHLHAAGYLVAVETNGTINPATWAPLVQHLTLSPKLPPQDILVRWCQTLKVLWPHPNPEITPLAYDFVDAEQRFIQPITADDPSVTEANMQSAIAWLLKHPAWRLSVQLHKLIGVD